MPNPIEEFDTYYYKHYLPLHRHPMTKMLHMLGQLVTFIYLMAGLIVATSFAFLIFILLTTPLIVYFFAWPAHWLIEKNKPAAWKRPFLAKLCDIRMMYEVLTGRLPVDTRV